MPDFTLADILAGLTPPVPQPIVDFGVGLGRAAAGAAALPGDVYAGRTEADLANPEYTRRAFDLASMLVGTPGGSGGLGSGIRAYHGSPYDFDKFDLSKIGTGEGAQAYGHGLYFAENPKVAQEYRDALSRKMLPDNQQTDLAQSMFTAARGDAGKAIQKLQEEIAYYDKRGWPTPDYRNQYDTAIANLKAGNIQTPGKMYEVNINAKPEQFLNWDAPAPQIAKDAADRALPRSGIFTPEQERMFSGSRYNVIADPQTSGQDLYETLSRGLSEGYSKAAASDVLKEAGIPGIRYLDQGSRNPAFSGVTLPQIETRIAELKQSGADPAQLSRMENWRDQYNARTSNYVVFNPDIVDIRKKWALLLAAMGGAGAPTMGSVLQSQQEPTAP